MENGLISSAPHAKSIAFVNFESMYFAAEPGGPEASKVGTSLAGLRDRDHPTNGICARGANMV